MLVVLDEKAEEGQAGGDGGPDGPTAEATASPSAGGAGSGGSGRGLRNWRLRSKLALILIIPTITALVLGGLRVYESLDRANQLRQTADQVQLADQISDVVHQLQIERELAVLKLGANPGNTERANLFNAQVDQVDTAVGRLNDLAGELTVDDPAMQARYDSGVNRLGVLESMRQAVTEGAMTPRTLLDQYTLLITGLVQLDREVTTAINDRDLLRDSNAIHALSEAKEYISLEGAIVSLAAQQNDFPQYMVDDARDAMASGESASEDFNAYASLQQRQYFTDTVSAPEIDRRQMVRDQAFARVANDEPPQINRQEFVNDLAVTRDNYREAESGLLSDLEQQSAGLAEDTTFAAWRDAAIVAIALIAALALMLYVSRSMLAPLRTLRENALEVAYVRLPETVRRILADPNPMEASRKGISPVPVETKEEIGEVARSFDVVHERAVRMAAEQALLRENVNGIFVNLSRRSQRLVERQLGVIDSLESEEQDPDQLAHLFELDHLATRLRRNGESLLVLSGAGLSKSMAKPVPAADVVGASVSEIEQYARVEVGSVPDVAVHGRAVNDLVHLLAELLDNATYFSEPDTRISVRAAVTRKRSLAIQITDRGVGMSEEQFAEANERLADPPDLDVSVTRRMGLYVVARLAQRHGIDVRLRENEDIEGGVVARVVVPRELLTDAPGGPAGMTPAMGGQHNGSYAGVPAAAELPMRRLADAEGVGGPVPDATAAQPTSAFEPAQAFDGSRWPSAEDVPEDASELDYLSGAPGGGDPATTVMPAASGPAGGGSEDGQPGLTPLDQPISLDDLVGGPNKAAGPFVSPAEQEPDALPKRTPGETTGSAQPSWPPQQPADIGNGNGWPDTTGDGGSAAGTVPEDNPLALPKREPRYVSPESAAGSGTSQGISGNGTTGAAGAAAAAGAAQAGTESAALEEEAPTKRLPIYQSVLSRWFSEEEEDVPEAGAGDQTSDVADAGTALAGASSGGASAGGVQEDWRSVSDTGWEAAQSLLEPKGEEITTAGLPKRVPNAYLVPGSVTEASDTTPASSAGAEADPAAAAPTATAKPAVSRSAEAARNRMASFQRGFTSGRHALKEQPDQTGTQSEAESNGSTDNGVHGAKE
ncbi:MULTISPECIES: nitrate- and nitrite sensing domain-containing protein [Prauserella salsuginis group]|uniref:histidine kinase n=1 Tax=Prauserella salsuginis TaxID=387889 RepID=A0ABW6G796_9PSEU|nr:MULTISPECIES: nitrate- and nitrite sensing domain-containing protein [Prauserella salsuginis group]